MNYGRACTQQEHYMSTLSYPGGVKMQARHVLVALNVKEQCQAHQEGSESGTQVIGVQDTVVTKFMLTIFRGTSDRACIKHLENQLQGIMSTTGGSIWLPDSIEAHTCNCPAQCVTDDR